VYEVNKKAAEFDKKINENLMTKENSEKAYKFSRLLKKRKEN